MAKTILTIDSLQHLIGSTVEDPYGRVLGRLVSIESDVDGTVTSVAVETEDRRTRFIPAKAVKLNGNKVIVWPEWKVLAAEAISGYQTAVKRLRGLEEMYRRNEIPAAVYSELKKKLDAGLSRMKEEVKRLRELLKVRMNELEDENLRVERAIANLKVSYLAGEIGEKPFNTAMSMLRQAKDTIVKEMDDIKATINKLDALEKGVEKTVKGEAEAKAPSAVQQPIPVKIVEG